MKTLLADPRAFRRNQVPLPLDGKCVVYWMQRAQRAFDNPALDAAIEVANELGLPCVVHLGIVPFYPNANLRHYAFHLDNLVEIEAGVVARGCAFAFRPYPDHRLEPFCRDVRAAVVVGDENPLRQTEEWRQKLAAELPVPLFTIDADVVVPTRLFPKEEFAARTIRPKITRELEWYLLPSKEPHCKTAWSERARPKSVAIDKGKILAKLPLDRSVAPVEGARGGSKAALTELADFVKHRLAAYAERRNQPQHADGTSRMSAYLHFGHIGPRHIALAVKAAKLKPAEEESRASYLEELIVRREVAINYVARNPHYDTFAGLHAWAKATLDAHREDERPYLYSEHEFETAKTHDPLWNAGQRELVATGRMHGYVRMYWAKKILEWTKTPEDAFAIAVRLNDKYLLDGRDPNGYTGIAWALGGKHDRPWAPARKIFGTIRFMSFASTSKKFDWKGYATRVEGGPQQGRLL